MPLSLFLISTLHAPKAADSVTDTAAVSVSRVNSVPIALMLFAETHLSADLTSTEPPVKTRSPATFIPLLVRGEVSFLKESPARICISHSVNEASPPMNIASSDVVSLTTAFLILIRKVSNAYCVEVASTLPPVMVTELAAIAVVGILFPFASYEGGRTALPPEIVYIFEFTDSKVVYA